MSTLDGTLTSLQSAKQGLIPNIPSVLQSTWQALQARAIAVSGAIQSMQTQLAANQIIIDEHPFQYATASVTGTTPLPTAYSTRPITSATTFPWLSWPGTTCRIETKGAYLLIANAHFTWNNTLDLIGLRLVVDRADGTTRAFTAEFSDDDTTNGQCSRTVNTAIELTDSQVPAIISYQIYSRLSDATSLLTSTIDRTNFQIARINHA